MLPNPKLPADLITFTEEILNGKLHFLCNVVVESGVHSSLHENFHHQLYMQSLI